MVTAQIAGDEKCNGTTVTRITIGKAAAPQIIWPTASSVEAGSSLSASVLAGGSTEYGSFTWKDPAQLAEAGTHSYEVEFTPNAGAALNYEIQPMIGVVELTATMPASDNRNHNTADRDSSLTVMHPLPQSEKIDRGRIGSDRGITTAQLTVRPADVQSLDAGCTYGWWLPFADNNYLKEDPVFRMHGTCKRKLVSI